MQSDNILQSYDLVPLSRHCSPVHQTALILGLTFYSVRRIYLCEKRHKTTFTQRKN